MKKLALLLAAAVMLSTNVFAQNDKAKETWTETIEGEDAGGKFTQTTNYEKNAIKMGEFWHNWTLSIGAGVQAYMGENDWKAKFKDWWTAPAIDLYINKWVSPVFGMGIGVTGYKMRGLYQQTNPNAHFKTDEFYKSNDGQQLYVQKGNMINPQIYAMLDIDNAIAGYNPDRFYNVAIYAGGGVAIGWDKEYNNFGATFNAGLVNTFRVWDRLHIVLNLRGALVSDEFDGEGRGEEPTLAHIKGNFPLDGLVGATLGLSYRFGKKADKEWNQVSSTVKTYLATNTVTDTKELDELRAALQKSQLENENLSNTIKGMSVYDYKKDPMHLWYHVQFEINKWDVNNREMVNLKAIAEIMNKVPGTKFSLCGYADKQTATADHNRKLSENRVNKVYDILTKELGVNPDQLEKSFEGGVDLMFYNDNTLSRCVIIKTAE